MLTAVTFPEGPPLTDQQVSSLQEALGSEVNIQRRAIEDAMESPPQHGIVWPYSRGVPKPANDILSQIDRDHVVVVNDYQKGHDLSNKWINYQQAQAQGIPIPETFGMSSEESIDSLTLPYPLVVKGYPSGRGEDVHLCSDNEAARHAYRSCAEKGLGIVAQDYIRKSHGQDLRVLVVDGEIAQLFKRQGPPGQFYSNIAHGGSYMHYNLTTEDRRIVDGTIEQFPVDVAGIDFLFSENGILFNEVNLSPGWSREAQAIVPFLAKLIKTRARVAATLS